MKSCFLFLSLWLYWANAAAEVVHHGMLDGAKLTYDTAKEYCDRRAMRLCSFNEICANRNPPVVGVLDSDRWVPISDTYNDWVQIGENRLCYKHIEHYGAPVWGITAGGCTTRKDCPIKKHVLCCGGVELDGDYLTYDTARSYCLERGKDLCKHEEICDGSTLTAMPVPVGDHWVPVRDTYNDWTEIGNDAGRTCYRHVAKYGFPKWGTTVGPCPPWNTSQEACPHKGYVLCCASSDPATLPQPRSYNIYHFLLEPNWVTWLSARNFCQAQPGRDLCSAAQICPDGIPLLTGVQMGDNWAPIINSNPQGIRDWIEIGNDVDQLRYARRVCFKHVEHYGATSWGDTAGRCGQWTDAAGVCTIKRHVFCCSAMNKRANCY